jgi:hypothetical protein
MVSSQALAVVWLKDSLKPASINTRDKQIHSCKADFWGIIAASDRNHAMAREVISERRLWTALVKCGLSAVRWELEPTSQVDC